MICKNHTGELWSISDHLQYCTSTLVETREILFPQKVLQDKNIQKMVGIWHHFIKIYSVKKRIYFPSYPDLKMNKEDCSRYAARKEKV